MDRDDTGKEYPRLNETVSSFIDNAKFRLNSVEGSIVLLDTFYKHFNLYTESMEDKLIGPVIYRESEQLRRPTRLVKLISLYTDNKIGDYFKLSISEFLQLNISEINLLIENARISLSKKNVDMDSLISENKEIFGE